MTNDRLFNLALMSRVRHSTHQLWRPGNQICEDGFFTTSTQVQGRRLYLVVHGMAIPFVQSVILYNPLYNTVNPEMQFKIFLVGSLGPSCLNSGLARCLKVLRERIYFDVNQRRESSSRTQMK